MCFKLPKRLRCSKQNTEFSYPEDLPFDSYINKTAKMIEVTRLDLDLGDHVIQANCPVQANTDAKPREIGILLLHGLLDSPMMMQSLFEHFAAHNYLVRSLLLPGHGTVPGDLLKVKSESWSRAVEYGIKSFAQEVKHLFIVGLSTGGSLALLHAAKNKNVKGIILFAPAIRIKNPFALLSGAFKFLGSIIPRAAWLNIAKDEDYAKYQSIAFNGVHQVHHLSKQVRRFRRAMLPPMFMVLSDDDEIISTKSAEKFFLQQSNEVNHLFIYSNDRKNHSDRRVEIRPSAHPGQHILNYSHISLTNAPEHPHYGMHGDFEDFQHYERWWSKPFRKAPGQTVYSGAITPDNLKQHTLRRLSFNPDFYYMMEKIDEFIEKTVSNLA